MSRQPIHCEWRKLMSCSDPTWSSYLDPYTNTWDKLRSASADEHIWDVNCRWYEEPVEVAHRHYTRTELWTCWCVIFVHLQTFCMLTSSVSIARRPPSTAQFNPFLSSAAKGPAYPPIASTAPRRAKRGESLMSINGSPVRLFLPSKWFV